MVGFGVFFEEGWSEGGFDCYLASLVSHREEVGCHDITVSLE